MVKAMGKVHVMTKAEKMIISHNQDGDANGESLMEGDIYGSGHAKELVVGSIREGIKYVASPINLISKRYLIT